jgi:hypothetical protein
MKNYRLRGKSGDMIVSVWPPQWAFSDRPEDPLALWPESATPKGAAGRFGMLNSAVTAIQDGRAKSRHEEK